MRQSFLIVVTNKTNKSFSIHGPMLNDTEIINRVVAAQKAGSHITCHNPGTLDRDIIFQEAREQGLSQVPDAIP